MRCFLLLLSWSCILQVQAQTKLIAYKSHSGNVDFFLPDAQPEDDYGMPPIEIIQIEKLNDSTIVETSKYLRGDGLAITDTIVNHPYFSDPKLSLEKIKQRYYNSRIEFKGFEENKTFKSKAKRKGRAKRKSRAKRKGKAKLKGKKEKSLKKKISATSSELKMSPNSAKINNKIATKQETSEEVRNFEASKKQTSDQSIILAALGKDEPPTTGNSSWFLIIGFSLLYILSWVWLIYQRQFSRSATA